MAVLLGIVSAFQEGKREKMALKVCLPFSGFLRNLILTYIPVSFLDNFCLSVQNYSFPSPCYVSWEVDLYGLSQ